MEIRLFGGVSAWSDGTEVDLGGPKQRLILARLAMDAERGVTLERILDTVWAGAPPARADVSVRGYTSNLRKVLAAHTSAVTLKWRNGGYVLSGPVDVDIHRFEALITAGRDDERHGRVATAKSALESALDLWTGSPLGGYADSLELTERIARWEEMRGEAIERLFDLRLLFGEHRECVADLGKALLEYPYRERLRVQLAIALYRSGRPVEALRSIQLARRTLIDDIGVDIGTDLRTIEARVHAQDPGLDWSHDPEDPTTFAPASREGPASIARRLTQLFGRGVEIDTLTAALREVGAAGAGGGGAFVIEGEAGVGKSAVVEVLADRAREYGFAVAWARCRESTSASPYWPWHLALGELAKGRSGAGATADLATALDAARDEPHQLADPAAARLAVHVAVRDALTRLPDRCLIVMDDIHWADTASLLLLEFLAPDLGDLGAAFALVRRSGPIGPAMGRCLAEIARSPGSVRLRLAPLGRDAVGDWLDHARITADPGDLTTALHERTGGNAFFVREAIALLQGHASDPARLSCLAQEIPPAVHDVVRRRTSQLEAQTQRVLVIAAAIGREFDSELLAHAAGLARDEVLGMLAPAIDAQLIVAEVNRPGLFRFSHAIVADALVAELNPVRRSRMHADITRALRDRWALDPDAVLPQLTHHAFAGAAAGCADEAIEYSLRSARLATGAHAYADAASHLERALAVVQSNTPQDAGRRIAVSTELGICQVLATDMVAGRASLLSAATLAESVGDHPSVVRALAQVNADDLWTSLDWGEHDPDTVALLERTLLALDPADHQDRAALLGALAGQTYYVDPRRSITAAAAAVGAAEMTGDATLLFRVLLQQYWAEWRPSGHDARCAIADRMLDLVTHDGLPARFTPLAHLARFTVAFEAADGATAERHLGLARELADPRLTPAAWTYVLYATVSLELLRGQFDVAATTIDDLYKAMRRSRPFTAETTRAGLVMQLHAEQGRFDAALEDASVLESSIFASPVAWFRAWALAEAGREPEVASALAAYDGPPADDWFAMPLLTAAITAAAASGNVDFLRQHIDQLRPMAAMVACTGSGGMVLGPVALALASASSVLGDHDGATQYLNQARGIIDKLGARPWDRRARVLQAALEG